MEDTESALNRMQSLRHLNALRIRLSPADAENELQLTRERDQRQGVQVCSPC
jgi:hypothetical protein